MLRFKQQTRRDHVVSLLPPISVIKNKEPSAQERIYSDTPPPVTYTGSFPAKVLRHLDRSTFYSTPTKGETLLATKTMHDEERRINEKNDPKKTSRSEDKEDSRTHQNNRNRTVKSKIKKKGKERKDDGMEKAERRCSSAPGFREDELAEQLLETGNLTAPVTPRFSPLTNDTRSKEKTSRVCTPARSPTPREFASPDSRIIEQESEVMLELRGDRIEMGSHVKDFRGDSTPTPRVGTPCRLRTPEGMYQARPKIRSAIREVPCAQRRSEKVPRVPQQFEIRAVGFSLPFHEKSESNSTLRTKEKKNDTKVIKIPRAEGEDPSMLRSSLSLPTVTEAEDTRRDEENNPKSDADSAEEPASKENNNSQENEKTESNTNTKADSSDTQNVSDESTENEQREHTENVVKLSEKIEELPENENGPKENGSGHENEMNEHKTESETDVTKNQKKKSSPMDKRGGRRNSKTKGHKK